MDHYIMDHDNGLTYNLTYCLGSLWTMTRSYLQFNMLFGLHYGSWQTSYLQFNMLFGLHYGSWQGLTYNLTYCLGYIMDHDKVLPTI